jgi:orotate phosphoribosyltransferase
MMVFRKEEFDKLILDNKVVGIKPEPFKLKSGRLSYWYANCRVMSDTYELLDKTASFVIDFIVDHKLDFDYVYGVPAGATKLAVAINYKLGQENDRDSQKIIIGREKPKEHGDPKDRYFIGPVQSGDNVIVLEDVTTTGGSVIDQLKFLKEAGLNIIAVVALVNRLEKRDDGLGVAEYIMKQFNVPYYNLTDAQRILPIAIKHGNLAKDMVAKVEETVNQVSISPIKL